MLPSDMAGRGLGLGLGSVDVLCFVAVSRELRAAREKKGRKKSKEVRAKSNNRRSC